MVQSLWTVSLLDEWLASVRVDRSIFELCPDYCAGLMVVAGIESGESDVVSDRWLESATTGSIDPDDGHVERWRDAYRAFGAKPRRTRVSVDALTRRAAQSGLPRINKVTDTYNAISVLHQIPIGVEDLDAYAGALRLVRADGTEPFDTTRDGLPVVEDPEPGEPVWRDETGITCRRWNWRQTTRTAITDTTTSAVFVVDALGPHARQRATTAIETLRDALAHDRPSATTLIDSASPGGRCRPQRGR